MGNPTNVTNPFETGGKSVLKQDMSTRHFLGMGVKTLLALGATKASNVLGQTLPSTYNEIIAALNKGELTYEQLIEIGKKYNGNFNDDQRKVLSGELAKLKMEKEKPRIVEKKPTLGSKEEMEVKKAKKDQNIAVTNANKSLIDHRSWVVSTDKTDSAKARKSNDGKGFQVEFVDKGSPKPVRMGGVQSRIQLPGGNYNMEIDITPQDAFRVYLYGNDGKEINADGSIATPGKAKITLQNGKNSFPIPNNCVSVGFFTLVTPVNKVVKINKIELSLVEDGVVAAGK